MLYTLIPLVVILASAALAIYIIARRFPQLSNLDTENLPAEREARKKREIITRRIEAQGSKIRQAWRVRLQPLAKLLGKLQLRFRVYVGRIERLLHHEQRAKRKFVAQTSDDNKEQKLMNVIHEGEQELKNEHLERAEELFIGAIKIDPKSVPAYRGLADTYLAKGSLDEAQETYLFLLQLSPNEDNVMVKIADIAEQKGDLDKAINFYQQAVVLNDSLSSRFHHLAELLIKVSQPEVAKEAILQAVELEPRNPKYLDLLIETVLLCGDKEMAVKAYNELRLVNPNNQKLADFHQRINALA